MNHLPIFPIYSPKNSILGSELLYRCRGCNTNLTSNNPASQYQKQKLIQNTVRVPSSIYTMNLAALNAYQKPDTVFETVLINGANYLVSPGVNWNQMSDRRKPHVQKVVSGGGSFYRPSSVRRSATALRPGSLSPGGLGVDIKHNSYDRYLNRIKGKAPLRRGVIPPLFGVPYIPFNRAFPIYGGKLFKTSIVNNCNCPIVDGPDAKQVLYEGSSQDQIYSVKQTFSIGNEVWAFDSRSSLWAKALIVELQGELARIVFLEDNFPLWVPQNNLILSIVKPVCKSICSEILPTEILFSSINDDTGVLDKCVLSL